METVSGWFEALLFGGAKRGRGAAALTVIGTGGKTSLIWLLAGSLARPACGERSVLVTPATKMFLPAGDAKPFDRYSPWGLIPKNPLRGGALGRLKKVTNRINGSKPHSTNHFLSNDRFFCEKSDTPPLCGGVVHCNGTPDAALPGVTLAGSFNTQSGKLESLSPSILERIAPDYDVTLVEGDGSRALPLKGWAEHEPVVPPFTTVTVGVIPLWPLGMPASPDIVHRLPLFCALTGAEPGRPIQAAHIAAAICGGRQHGTNAHCKSLFSAARGKRILFFNQVEDEAARVHAEEVVSLLPPAFCAGLDYIISGSVKRNTLFI